MITFDMNVCLELRWDGQQGRRISVFIFSGGDYILLSKTVILKWNHRMKNYYINKGYHLTNIGDEFEVSLISTMVVIKSLFSSMKTKSILKINI